MTEIEIAYLAGLFDGEGCIHIKKTRRPDTPCGVQYALQTSVRMTNKNAVDKFYNAFGGHVYPCSKRFPWHKDMWQWIALSSIAQVFLMDTMPYLIVKKDEAKLALEFQVEKKRTVGQKGIKGFARKTTEEIKKEEKYYRNMRDLKLQNAGEQYEQM
jgi:hypothetical protein